jgi:isopenicillin-N epimerase
MSLNRRQLLGALAGGIAVGTARCGRATDARQTETAATGGAAPIRHANGAVDWEAVRRLFPLSTDLTHLASFLLVSHPKPVTEAIEFFRRKIDADPVWLEAAAFSESEGKPFVKVKTALAGYIGGTPEQICLTANTTTGLALVYHGLRIRSDQEILTTEHEHYSHHESMRYAAERNGCRIRYVPLYEQAAAARPADMADRIARGITPRTRAVGITWVHSSTGVKTPIRAIADVVERANRGRASADRCLLVVDGVHGFGNQDVDVAGLGCDFFASGTHKWLFAPRGTGVLWARADAWPELRPTVPSFDPEGMQTWEAWMARGPLPPTQASFVSPGGFVAYEYLLAVPAAVELHRAIGRDRIASRISELNAAFRDGASTLPNVTLHTPRDPEVSGGISCFEVKGVAPAHVAERLAAKKIRTNSSPYKTSYARVAAGVMNTPEEIELVLREIRELR